MGYCTPDELAAAVGKPLTPANTPGMQACIDAGAVEINSYIDSPDGEPVPPSGLPLANRVNLLRAVEWWKANDAAFGVIGYDGTGSLLAPRDGFARHQRTLTPLKRQFGVA